MCPLAILQTEVCSIPIFLSSTPRRPGPSELYIYAEIAREESGMGYKAERECVEREAGRV